MTYPDSADLQSVLTILVKKHLSKIINNIPLKSVFIFSYFVGTENIFSAIEVTFFILPYLIKSYRIVFLSRFKSISEFSKTIDLF